MSDQSGGPGWWVANDGRWYAPELHPDRLSATHPTQPPPDDPPPTRSRRNLLIALALLVALVLVAVAAMARDDSPDDDRVAETRETDDEVTTTEPRTTTEAEQPKDLTVESGFSSAVNSINTTSVGALLTNPNATLALYDVSVVFNLLDASGATIDTDTTQVPYIPAASTVPVAPLLIGFDNPTEPTAVDVNVTGTFEEDTGWAGVEFPMSDGIDLEVSRERRWLQGPSPRVSSFTRPIPRTR